MIVIIACPTCMHCVITLIRSDSLFPADTMTHSDTSLSLPYYVKTTQLNTTPLRHNARQIPCSTLLPTRSFCLTVEFLDTFLPRVSLYTVTPPVQHHGEM